MYARPLAGEAILDMALTGLLGDAGGVSSLICRMHANRPSFRPRIRPIVHASSGTKLDLQAAKEEVVRLSGDKYGLDRSEAQKQQIVAKVRELEAAQVVEDLELTG